MNCTDFFTDLMDSYGFCSQSLQVWSTQGWQVCRHTTMVGNVKIALSENIVLLLHPRVDVPYSLVVT